MQSLKQIKWMQANLKHIFFYKITHADFSALNINHAKQIYQEPEQTKIPNLSKLTETFIR